MSVTVALNVTYPDNSPVAPVVGSPVQYNPYVDAGVLRPWFADGQGGYAGTGDGSGGSMRFTFPFRPAGDDRPIFVTISQAFGLTNSQEAQALTLAATGIVWERGPHERSELNITAPYWFPKKLVEAGDPLTLGKGQTGDILEMVMTFEVNTNTAGYQIFASGFVSDRPFLTSRNILPL